MFTMEIIIAIFRHGKQRKIELIGCLFDMQNKRKQKESMTFCDFL